MAMLTFQWLDQLLQDFRYGVRQLGAQPGYSAAAILSLALGIGANTAIFTIADQVLIRMLPVRDPAELVRFRVEGRRLGSNNGDGRHTFSHPTYLALRDRNTVFAGVTGERVQATSLALGERNELIQLGMIAGNYFELLGIQAASGRLITPDDDRLIDGHPVAVLQHDFWMNRFQGRRDAIGQTIRLNGRPFTIVGVAAPGFEGTDPGFPTKAWIPVMMKGAITPADRNLEDERYSWFYPFARLKPGVSLSQAQSAMRVLYRQVQEEELKRPYFSRFPQFREPFLRQTFSLIPASRGSSTLGNRFERPIQILQWLVGAVLLIACTNVASLLLARSTARQREFAIRGAIGAGRGRIIRQLLSESTILALAGGAGGLLLGFLLTQTLLRALPFNPGEFTISAVPDLRVLLFSLGLTLSTVILFGLLPAWQSARIAPASTMRQESGGIAGGYGQVRLRQLFVGLQVALSVMLLLGAGLFLRTLMNLQNVQLGMHRDNVVTFWVGPAAPLTDSRKVPLYHQLIETLAQVPGVRAVGANRVRLFTGGRSDGSITIPGIDESKEASSFFHWITPGYLDAMGIRIKGGRDITWQDWDSQRKVALVNERFADEYFQNSTPIGRMVGRGLRTNPVIEIVGTMTNARYHEVRGEIPRQLFLNMTGEIQFVSGLNIYARVTGDPRPAMAALRQATLQVSRDFLVEDMRTLDDQINFLLANERLVSYLSAGFAILASVLAVVGLHGVLAFVIARRTKEIGIRVALGAERGSVIRLISGQMLAVIVAGLAAGLVGGFFAARYIESLLFGVQPADPLVFSLATLLLFGAALIATLLPAWRASRLDPLRALRYE